MIPLDGPLPRPPRFNVLTVAQEAPDVLEADGGVSERWGNGVQLIPYPDELPGGFDPCSTGTFRLKDEGDGVPLPVFLAFTAYLPIKCTAAGARDDAEFRARATVALTATEAWAMERQLAYGDPMGENPFLNDGDLQDIGGAATSAVRGLRLLEERIAQTGKAGVIHMTPGTVNVLGDRLWRDAQTLRTPAGTPVVSGAGYVPDGAVADDARMWATGPLLYRRSEMLINPPTISEALDRSNNDLVYRAERDVLIAWDTLLQVAVDVSLA